MFLGPTWSLWGVSTWLVFRSFTVCKPFWDDFETAFFESAKAEVLASSKHVATDSKQRMGMRHHELSTSIIIYAHHSPYLKLQIYTSICPLEN